jgi:uncharacterized protein
MKILINVKPNASKQSLTIADNGIYRLELKSAPEKNKANLELIKILSKYFKVNQKDIVIKAGKSNQKKLVEVKNEI